MEKKRLLATALSIFTLVSAIGMTACGDLEEDMGGGNNKIENVYNVPSDSKITIKIKNFGMGPGNLWLEETMERFAEANKDVKYGDKTGVYLKYEATNNQNTSAMASDTTNIFFDERMSDPYALLQNGLLLNLDSIVKDDTRAGGSLESKIFDAAKGGITGNDGSYYALPHYEFYAGIAYNRTTFADLGAYFAAEDEESVYTYSCKYGTANFIDDAEAEKSVGPDGKAGTNDDGLPCSLDEFIILCDYIKTESEGDVSPITVSGKYYNYYPEYLLMGLWSSIAGPEQMRNYYNCTGEIEVVERDANGNMQFTNENMFKGISYVKKPKTKMVTMSADGKDGWMGNDMAAKYYAYAMLDIIEAEGFFSKTATSGDDHWTSQMDLYMDGKAQRQNAAMLVEGSYWYNESNENGGFDAYERYVGKNRNELDVAWMSLPTSVYAEGAEGRDACFLDVGLAYTMINKNVESNPALKQACLDFVAFCYSEQELCNFTAKTGITRAISYELSDTDKQKMSRYALRLWEERDSENGSNIVAWSGSTEIFKQVKGRLKIDLNSGVFGNGTTKVSAMLREMNVQEAFAACSLYGNWNY